MDLSKPVTYRGFNANSVALGAGGVISGCAIEQVDFSPVSGVGYTEKRALGDGRDASDVTLDGRRIVLIGTLYGVTRRELFDLLQHLRSVFHPVAAFNESPGSYGYVPLEWTEPTDNVADWPTNERTLYINARPLAAPSFQIIRDRLGGLNELGASIPWSVQMDAIDPRIYVSPMVFIQLPTRTSNFGSGTLVNRGDYPAPLNILLEVPTHPKPGFFTFVGGGSNMKIEVPASGNTQVIRYDGYKKVLTVEELGTELLRMDLLTFQNQTTHPLVLPGSAPWSWDTRWTGGGTTYQTITPGANSRVFYSEAFA